MKTPLTVLLAAVVLAHSLAGCCCHHVHAEEAGGHATCHMHSHGHEHSEDGTDREKPGELCDEESCVFLRGDGTPSLELAFDLAPDGRVVIADDTRLTSERTTRAVCPDSRSHAPPARLHLLHQILLI